jgi:hypothetical protein
MFPIDSVVQQESLLIDGENSDPDPMFSGQSQDPVRDLNESLLMEVLQLSLKCPQENALLTASENDVAILISTPDEEVGQNFGQNSVAKFDIFDEATEEYDEDCSVFKSDLSIKKPAINFCRSISMPYTRNAMQSESGLQQVRFFLTDLILRKKFNYVKVKLDKILLFRLKVVTLHNNKEDS